MLFSENFYKFFGIIDGGFQGGNAVTVVIDADDKCEVAFKHIPLESSYKDNLNT